MRKSLFTLLLFFTAIGVIVSQKSDSISAKPVKKWKPKTEEKTKQLPSVAIGIGVLTFFGNIGNGVRPSEYSRNRGGYNLTIEERIGRYIGISIGGLMGKLADEENSSTRNLNFQSKIFQGDLCLVAHFDNDLIFQRKSIFAPYILAGISYLKFDPYGDLKDKNGNTYHYWSDGTIRNIDEAAPNYFQAQIIQRDYTYETQLKDSTTDYKRHTISIPVGLGFKLKLHHNIDINLGATYYFTMTKWIDNVGTGKNDKYLFTHFSIQYNFGKEEDNSRPQYKSVDFSSIDKLDSDGDGVPDKDDKCPGTPKGVKVDSKGCPLDSDGDGVPDYLDKEPYTAPGALVDENGVTVSDSTLAQKQMMFDSLATERSKLLFENPTLAYLYEVEAKSKESHKNDANGKSKIPDALRPADLNNDGFISTDEIAKAIDAFFEGDSSFTVEKLNQLIDYFFDQ